MNGYNPRKRLFAGRKILAWTVIFVLLVSLVPDYPARAQAPYQGTLLSSSHQYLSVNTQSGNSSSLITIEVRNDGTQTWYNYGANIVSINYRYEPTDTPGDNNNTNSHFGCGNWITPYQYRVSTMNETSVAPGQVATFNFWVCNEHAEPAESGYWKEHFALAYGSNWMSDGYGDVPKFIAHVDITAALYQISGYVKDSGGNGVTGVTINFDGARPAVTTNSSGYYTQSGFANGTYTVSPTKTNCTFTPTSRPVPVNNGNQANINFTAACTQPIWKASILSASPIFVDVSPGGAQSDLFTVTALNGGNTTWQQSGTEAVCINYRYEPTDTPGDNNNTNSHFGCPNWVSAYRVSCMNETSVAPGQTATFSFWACNEHGEPASTTYDWQEHFALGYGSNWMPDGAGDVAKFVTNIRVVNDAFNISGFVLNANGQGESGVVMDFGGAQPAVTTSETGFYSQSGFSNGAYTITPEKNGCTFTPAFWMVPVEGENQDHIDFTAACIPPTVQLKWSKQTAPNQVVKQDETGELIHVLDIPADTRTTVTGVFTNTSALTLQRSRVRVRAYYPVGFEPTRQCPRHGSGETGDLSNLYSAYSDPAAWLDAPNGIAAYMQESSVPPGGTVHFVFSLFADTQNGADERICDEHYVIEYDATGTGQWEKVSNPDNGDVEGNASIWWRIKDEEVCKYNPIPYKLEVGYGAADRKCLTNGYFQKYEFTVHSPGDYTIRVVAQTGYAKLFVSLNDPNISPTHYTWAASEKGNNFEELHIQASQVKTNDKIYIAVQDGSYSGDTSFDLIAARDHLATWVGQKEGDATDGYFTVDAGGSLSLWVEFISLGPADWLDGSNIALAEANECDGSNDFRKFRYPSLHGPYNSWVARGQQVDPVGYPIKYRFSFDVVVPEDLPSDDYRINLALGAGANGNSIQWVETQYTGNGCDYFARTWFPIRVRGKTPGKTTDLAAAWVEISQGTQNQTDPVNLVANRWLDGRLHFLVNGPAVDGLVGELQISYSDGRTPPAPLRAPLDTRYGNRVINFNIPEEWLRVPSGISVTFRGILNPDRAIPETNYSNNQADITFTPDHVQRFEVTVIPLRIQNRVADTSDTYFRKLWQMWPISDFKPTNDHEVALNISTEGACSYAWWSEILEEFRNEIAGAATSAHAYLGKVSSSLCSVRPSYWGMASGNTIVALDSKTIMAPHELGHVAGRNHPEDCSPANQPKDAYYPYANCKIGQYGLDLLTSDWAVKTIDKFTFSDYMGYAGLGNDGDSQWTSDYTYRGVLEYLKGLSSSSYTSVSVQQNAWQISGVISPTAQTVDFDPIIRLQTSASLQPAVGEPYTLEVLNGSNVMYSTTFSMATGEAFADENTLAEMAYIEYHHPIEQVFSILIPAQEGATHIIIRKDGQVWGQMVKSPNAPKVSWQNLPANPGSNPASFAWTGSDADGDNLEYRLDYSPDNGVTWYLAAIVKDGSQSIQLDPRLLPKGTNARWRIKAYDDFHEASAVSNIFSMPDQAPWASIITPANDMIIPAGSQFSALGTAYDPEDGALEGERLIWKLDGVVLNYGNTLSTIAMPNSGIFSLTFEAHDSFGNVSIVNRKITVTAQPVSPATLTLINQMPSFANLDISGNLGTFSLAEGIAKIFTNASAQNYGLQIASTLLGERFSRLVDFRCWNENMFITPGKLDTSTGELQITLLSGQQHTCIFQEKVNPYLIYLSLILR